MTDTTPAATPAAPPRQVRKLSIVIPVYNEAATVQDLVRRVVAAALPPGVDREIV